jgi:diacyltrehalose acyltransferase
MARHRMSGHRLPTTGGARKALVAGAAAAGLSGALVFGHATNTTVDLVRLANSAIGVGGLYDAAGERLPSKLSSTIVPSGYDYVGVAYPATVNLSGSRDAGIAPLDAAIGAAAGQPRVVVIGYSEGTLVAEAERRNLQARQSDSAPSSAQLSFVQLASPFAGNGGIFARFPGIGIPGVIDSMGPGAPTRYATTYVALEYDPYADFPAYFNPVSLLNSALAVLYGHNDRAYDPVDPSTNPAYVTHVGNDTYVLLYSRHLPLLAPLRALSAALHLTPLSEPVLGGIEPVLRLLVDAGYTDRTNANPAASLPFSPFTPPAKIIQVLAGLPGAVQQGATNFLNGGQTAPPELPNPDGNLQQATRPPTPQPLSASATSPTTSPPPARTAQILHPTVTSDGNAFRPGDVLDYAATGGAEPTPMTAATTTDPSPPASTTATSTTTATSMAPSTAPSTATTTPTGSDTADSNAASAPGGQGEAAA